MTRTPEWYVLWQKRDSAAGEAIITHLRDRRIVAQHEVAESERLLREAVPTYLKVLDGLGRKLEGRSTAGLAKNGVEQAVATAGLVPDAFGTTPLPPAHEPVARRALEDVLRDLLTWQLPRFAMLAVHQFVLYRPDLIPYLKEIHRDPLAALKRLSLGAASNRDGGVDPATVRQWAEQHAAELSAGCACDNCYKDGNASSPRAEHDLSAWQPNEKVTTLYEWLHHWYFGSHGRLSTTNASARIWSERRLGMRRAPHITAWVPRDECVKFIGDESRQRRREPQSGQFIGDESRQRLREHHSDQTDAEAVGSDIQKKERPLPHFSLSNEADPLSTTYQPAENLTDGVVVNHTRRAYPRDLGGLVRLRRCENLDRKSNAIDSLYPVDVNADCYWDENPDMAHRAAANKCPGCVGDPNAGQPFATCVRHGALPSSKNVRIVHLAEVSGKHRLLARALRAAGETGVSAIHDSGDLDIPERVLCHLIGVRILNRFGKIEDPLDSEPSAEQLRQAGRTLRECLEESRFVRQTLEALAKPSAMARNLIRLIDAVTEPQDDPDEVLDRAIRKAARPAADRPTWEAFARGLDETVPWGADEAIRQDTWDDED